MWPTAWPILTRFLEQNRELQIMRLVSHPNIVSLTSYFYSNGSGDKKEEVFLNLMLEFVPETIYRASRHYAKMKQSMPMISIKVRLRWRVIMIIVDCLRMGTTFVVNSIDCDYLMESTWMLHVLSSVVDCRMTLVDWHVTHYIALHVPNVAISCLHPLLRYLP